jgi:hypothetical protein
VHLELQQVVPIEVGLVGEEARVLFPRRKTSIIIEYGDKHGVMQHSCKRHYSIERNARNEPENPLHGMRKRERRFWRERKGIGRNCRLVCWLAWSSTIY